MPQYYDPAKYDPVARRAKYERAKERACLSPLFPLPQQPFFPVFPAWPAWPIGACVAQAPNAVVATVHESALQSTSLVTSEVSTSPPASPTSEPDRSLRPLTRSQTVTCRDALATAQSMQQNIDMAAEHLPLREMPVTGDMLEAAQPLRRAPLPTIAAEFLPEGKRSCGGDLLFPNLLCAYADAHRAPIFPMLPGAS